MKVQLLENRQLVIRNIPGTQNENLVTTIELTVPDIYSDYNKKIVFIDGKNINWDIFEDNKYDLTKVITKNKTIDFYIWLTSGDKDFRSKTYTLKFYDNIDASNEITPEEIGAVNKILSDVENAIDEMENIDIQVSKINNTAIITLTDRYGHSSTTNIYDGERGDPGYTPQRGVDYWTSEDKQEIIDEVNEDLQEYINKPFVNFKIQNGNLIVEVEEYGNNN